MSSFPQVGSFTETFSKQYQKQKVKQKVSYFVVTDFKAEDEYCTCDFNIRYFVNQQRDPWHLVLKHHLAYHLQHWGKNKILLSQASADVVIPNEFAGQVLFAAWHLWRDRLTIRVYMDGIISFSYLCITESVMLMKVLR